MLDDVAKSTVGITDNLFCEFSHRIYEHTRPVNRQASSSTSN